jgi:hypothetical protein
MVQFSVSFWDFAKPSTRAPVSVPFPEPAHERFNVVLGFLAHGARFARLAHLATHQFVVLSASDDSVKERFSMEPSYPDCLVEGMSANIC